MKKKLFIFVLFALFASFAFAQDFYAGTSTFQSDIYAGNTSFSTSMLGTQITPYSDSELLDYTTDTLVPFLLNFFVGFGVGSFVQGDKKGAVTALVGDIVSCATIIAGATLYSISIINFGFDYMFYIGIGLAVGGSIMATGFRIYEIVRPYNYSRNQLSLNEFDIANSHLTLAPVINPIDKEYGITATFKL